MFLGSVLESLFSGTSAEAVTEIFLWVLVLVLGFLIFGAKKRKWTTWVVQGQTILTTVGVLGTFVGIAVGLLGFDPKEIQQSVPLLLAGLTTAFQTSVVGMAFGLFFKHCPWIHPGDATKDASPEVGPEEIHEALSQQIQLLEATRDAIAGGEESSLAGQLKLLRVDIADQYRENHRTRKEFTEELWSQMSGFGDFLARSATEQVIEALKQVIVEFNEKLTEQFGENFKALDASVKKLVGWQENYRLQLERLHSLYEESVRSAAAVESSVNAIAESSASIPSAMEQLGTFVETANHQISELERHLAAFEELRDKAVAAVPETRQAIEAIISSLTDTMKEASNHHDNLANQMLEQQQKLAETQALQAEEAIKILQKMAEFGERMQQDVKMAVERSEEHLSHLADSMREGVSGLQEQIAASTKGLLDEQSRTVQQAVATFRTQMEEVIRNTRGSVEQQQEKMNEAMNQEIERVMNAMGRSLAQISDTFTRDYQKLTEQMRGIVSRAN